jgi:hypothetical protein
VRLFARFAGPSLVALAALFATRAAHAQQVWLEQAELRATDAVENGRFGLSVAVSGDTVLIGAPTKGGGVTDTSGAYVFEYDGAGKWVQKQKLTGPTDLVTSMGSAVALIGDTAFVAREDGTIFRFTRTNGTFALEPGVLAIPIIDTSPGVKMVAQADTLVAAGVGATGQMVVVFARQPDGSWAQQGMLSPPGGPPDASYATSLALDGDTVIVGDPGVSSVCASCGAVFVFTRSQGTWNYQASIVGAFTMTAASFGQAVYLLGDQAMIGAPGAWDADASLPLGGLFPYARKGGMWSASPFSLGPVPTNLLDVGEAIALTPDTLATRVDSVKRGTPGLWIIPTNAPQQMQVVFGHNVTASDQFGEALAIDGPTIIAGAPSKTRELINEGEAYIFRRGLDLGSMCGVAADCVSGFCTDHVCCDQACGNSDIFDCQACAYTSGEGNNGHCGPVSSSYACHTVIANECDNDTRCDGANITCPADTTKPDNTPCGMGGVCSGGMCTAPATMGVDAGPPNPAPLVSTSPGAGCAESSGAGDAAIVAIAGAVVGLSFVRRRRRG